MRDVYQEGSSDQLHNMLLRGQGRWEVISIIEFGNTKDAECPDTSGFSVMVGGGRILLQRESKERKCYLAGKVRSRKLFFFKD